MLLPIVFNKHLTVVWLALKVFSYLNTDFVGNFKRLLTSAFYILQLCNKCSLELYMLPGKCDSCDSNFTKLKFVH